ncbi:MAG TPA: hypothetical protein VF426_05530 [Marmoricola sp.]
MAMNTVISDQMAPLFAADGFLRDHSLSMLQWLMLIGTAILWLAVCGALVLFTQRKRRPRTEEQHERDVARGHRHIR